MPTILTTSIFVHIPKTGGSWVEEILRQPKHKEFFVKNITSVPTLSEFIGTVGKLAGHIAIFQMAYRMAVHKDKKYNVWYNHPQTWTLDVTFLGALSKVLPACPYSGFYGQYVGIHLGQLGRRLDRKAKRIKNINTDERLYKVEFP